MAAAEQVPRHMQLLIPDQLSDHILFRESSNAQVRENIFLRVGDLHNEEGVDVVRVDHYAHALGLRRAAYLITSHRQTVNAAVDPSLNNRHPSVQGIYKSDIGLGIIYRDANRQAAGVENALVHESIGHGSLGLNSGWVRHFQAMCDGLTRCVPPNGFTFGKHGAFLEEGFCRWIETNYSYTVGHVLSSPRQETAFWIPEIYRHKPLHYYDYAAIGWEVMCAAAPARFFIADKLDQYTALSGYEFVRSGSSG